MTRIFVTQKLAQGATLLLPAAASAHVAKVLRLRVADELTLFDGSGGEYAARIVDVARAGVSATVLAHRDVDRESPLDVTLLPAVVRGERMDFIVQKATELGAQRIQPVLCARGNIRLDEDGGARKLEHWRAVAISACEQCGRNTLPRISAPLALRDALADDGARLDAALRLLLLPTAVDSLGQLLGSAPPSVALLTGPEGGFDPAEEDAALQAGFRACRLGPRVLRTETAPLAALAAVQALAGDCK